jgi:hypothetical protein
MAYFCWLIYVLFVYWTDGADFWFQIHRYLADFLAGLIGLGGFFFMITAYIFLSKKLDADKKEQKWSWRVITAYSLLLSPLLILVL